jgi:hypothetical protein
VVDFAAGERTKSVTIDLNPVVTGKPSLDETIFFELQVRSGADKPVQDTTGAKEWNTAVQISDIDATKMVTITAHDLYCDVKFTALEPMTLEFDEEAGDSNLAIVVTRYGTYCKSGMPSKAVATWSSTAAEDTWFLFSAGGLLLLDTRTFETTATATFEFAAGATSITTHVSASGSEAPFLQGGNVTLSIKAFATPANATLPHAAERERVVTLNQRNGCFIGFTDSSARVNVKEPELLGTGVKLSVTRSGSTCNLSSKLEVYPQLYVTPKGTSDYDAAVLGSLTSGNLGDVLIDKGGILVGMSVALFSIGTSTTTMQVFVVPDDITEEAEVFDVGFATSTNCLRYSDAITSANTICALHDDKCTVTINRNDHTSTSSTGSTVTTTITATSTTSLTVTSLTTTTTDTSTQTQTTTTTETLSSTTSTMTSVTSVTSTLSTTTKKKIFCGDKTSPCQTGTDGPCFNRDDSFCLRALPVSGCDFNSLGFIGDWVECDGDGMVPTPSSTTATFTVTRTTTTASSVTTGSSVTTASSTTTITKTLTSQTTATITMTATTTTETETATVTTATTATKTNTVATVTVLNSKTETTRAISTPTIVLTDTTTTSATTTSVTTTSGTTTLTTPTHSVAFLQLEAQSLQGTLDGGEQAVLLFKRVLSQRVADVFNTASREITLIMPEKGDGYVGVKAPGSQTLVVERLTSWLESVQGRVDSIHVVEALTWYISDGIDSAKKQTVTIVDSDGPTTMITPTFVVSTTTPKSTTKRDDIVYSSSNDLSNEQSHNRPVELIVTLSAMVSFAALCLLGMQCGWSGKTFAGWVMGCAIAVGFIAFVVLWALGLFGMTPAHVYIIVSLAATFAIVLAILVAWCKPYQHRKKKMSASITTLKADRVENESYRSPYLKQLTKSIVQDTREHRAAPYKEAAASAALLPTRTNAVQTFGNSLPKGWVHRLNNPQTKRQSIEDVMGFWLDGPDFSTDTMETTDFGSTLVIGGHRRNPDHHQPHGESLVGNLPTPPTQIVPAPGTLSFLCDLDSIQVAQLIFFGKF